MLLTCPGSHRTGGTAARWCCRRGGCHPRIGAATSSTPGPSIPATHALRNAQGPYKLNAAAYASPQLEPKTPSTTPSCSGKSPCNCPVRTLGPQTKVSLPYPATEENIPKLRESMLDRYRASAFNVCKTELLPMIKGSPPLQLHVPSTSKPFACHVPATIPLHW